jgi:hypothetical protein
LEPRQTVVEIYLTFVIMIPVKETLVSDDIAKVKFCCDLPRCLGACCIAGDAGAPLEEDEIAQIQDNLEEIIPFMAPNGIEVVQESGVFDYDAAGNFVTPLVNGRECAFVYFTGKIARCAIEKAHDSGKIDFRKPVSCHLYPIRITSYNGFEAVNYHKWSICNKALSNGEELDLPVYRFLKDSLIRKYDEAWYNELVETIRQMKKKP